MLTNTHGTQLARPAALALLAALLGGCGPKATPPEADARGPSRVASPPDDSPVATAPRDANGYRAIAERDLFRPLVTAPKSAEGGGGGEAAAAGSGGSSATKAGAKPPGGPGGPVPGGRPDPTADLALTGIIETTDGLWALVEQISTKRGEFVAVGAMAFGMTVKEIQAGAITLVQGPRTYELKLGAKQIGGDTAAAPAPAAPSGPAQPAASAPTPPSGMPTFGGMSFDQRRDAFQNWWNSMSEEDRQRFRERRGGFGGGPGGGFGGGFGGGRGGPGGRRGG